MSLLMLDLGGFKSRSAASDADFSAPEVGFYYPFETRLAVLGMTCVFAGLPYL